MILRLSKGWGEIKETKVRFDFMGNSQVLVFRSPSFAGLFVFTSLEQ